MKRIVNGVTYNTDTATALGRSSWEDDGKVVETLHQTRGGAFFVHREKDVSVWNEKDRATLTSKEHSFQPVSPDAAHSWMMTGEVEVFRNPFDDPPEANAEKDPGATIYVRVPSSLKRAVDEAAAIEKVSGNVWSMRCLERCMQDDGRLKNLLGNLTYSLQYLTREDHRLGTIERLYLADELQSMIAHLWADRFSGDTSKKESLGRQIVSFADEQIEEHCEAAIQGSFIDSE